MRWRRARERCDVTVTSSVNNMTTSSSASSLKDRCAVVYRLCVRRRLLYHGVVLLFSGQWVALVPSSPLPSSRKKLDPSRGRCGPPSNTWFLGTTRVHAPSSISVGSSALAELIDLPRRRAAYQWAEGQYTMGRTCPRPPKRPFPRGCEFFPRLTHVRPTFGARKAVPQTASISIGSSVLAGFFGQPATASCCLLRPPASRWSC